MTATGVTSQESRPHQSLENSAPRSREIEPPSAEHWQLRINLAHPVSRLLDRKRAARCLSNRNQGAIRPSSKAIFKTAAFNRSATSPRNEIGHLERISRSRYPTSIQHTGLCGFDEPARLHHVSMSSISRRIPSISAARVSVLSVTD